MSSAIKQRTKYLNLTDSTERNRNEARVAQEKIGIARSLVEELQRELESLTQVPIPTVEHGLDFYTEVRRFESEMIRRALRFADGHQGSAARLLNLNTTTLNAMIKRYRIKTDPRD